VSRDEASSHARRLQKEDATFDIYVVDMYKWLLIPPDREHIDDVHYNDDKLEEIMSKYRENQALGTKMFEERKRDMIAKPLKGDMPYIKPGDENSKFYNKPDEPPISHPAEILERLKKDRPDAPVAELVIEADAIVAEEIKERGCNLDIKNPHSVADDHGDPEVLLEVLNAAEAQTASLRNQLKDILAEALAR
jgi:hypothetical protein